LRHSKRVYQTPAGHPKKHRKYLSQTGIARRFKEVDASREAVIEMNAGEGRPDV
jgi:hypothetical protein